MKAQQRPTSIARERSHELEALVVELDDELEYRKSAVDALTREVEALRSERETLIAEQRVSESWRLGLAEQLEDYARDDPFGLAAKATKGKPAAYRNAIRGILIGIPLAAVLWGALILLALFAYRLFTG